MNNAKKAISIEPLGVHKRGDFCFLAPWSECCSEVLHVAQANVLFPCV